MRVCDRCLSKEYGVEPYALKIDFKGKVRNEFKIDLCRECAPIFIRGVFSFDKSMRHSDSAQNQQTESDEDTSENESLKALLREAADVMDNSYDVRDWPGPDGAMGQVLKKILEIVGDGDAG